MAYAGEARGSVCRGLLAGHRSGYLASANGDGLCRQYKVWVVVDPSMVDSVAP